MTIFTLFSLFSFFKKKDNSSFGGKNDEFYILENELLAVKSDILEVLDLVGDDWLIID